jgi:hypothetical protein
MLTPENKLGRPAEEHYLGCLANRSEFMSKIEQLSASDCGIIGNHEVEKTYSPTGAVSPVPDVRCGPGREMRT